jgi:transposase
MLRAVESEHRDEREPTKPRDGVGQPETSSVASGASALVLGYIDGRAQEADMASRLADLMKLVLELQARLTKLEGAERRAAELEREVERLKAHNEKLVARIRELEIGFRRFVSERVPPEQLRLALEANSLAATDSVEAGSAAELSAPEAGVEKAPDPASPPPAQTVSTPPSGPGGSDPKAERKKNRHNHGRRRQTTVPKLIVEIVPAEVQRLGMESFERIGYEDSSTLGHRRGGPIELVTRRGKYVPIVPPSSASTLDTDNAQEPSAATKAPDAAVPDSEGAVVVVLHEAATVPADPACKSNPFVEGAIVYYTPKSPVPGAADAPVQIAPVPERPIHGGLVDASLLAHLFVHKFDYHTPYYRQEIEARRQGCPNSRTNMVRWQFEAGSVLMRIADAAWKDALDRSWFATDATGTAIQAKDKLRHGHVFVLVAPGDSVLFRYSDKYDHDTMKELFDGYEGTVVADASSTNNILFGPGKAKEAGCWSHARKPFVKAFEAGEKELPAFALKTIQDLFRIEEKLALHTPEGRLEGRLRESAPLVDALFAWVDEQGPKATDASLVRKGLVYLRNQREALHEFLRNGEIPMDNNACERALRRIVKGRRNWLSHGSADHAERACAISSLIASCELHGIDPEFYLQEILTVAPSWPASRALELAPKHWINTRQRLIAEGRLSYIDLARVTGSRLTFRAA